MEACSLLIGDTLVLTQPDTATLDCPSVPALSDPPVPGRLDPSHAATCSPSDRVIDYAQEQRFHDEWGMAITPEHVPVSEAFEACTAPENRFITGWLGGVRGLRILDLGCGAGEAATYFALQGAQVTAVDISEGMLDVTRKVAERHGVKVACVQGSAEQLEFSNDTFDVVYSANLLHHVDIHRCLGEIGRVLRPEGRFVSWDPLRHNPVINLYRRMAAAVRTEDETPLSIHDLNAFAKHFRHVEHRCFWLASLWIFVRFFLIERVHPSKERYWKRIITAADRLSGTYRRLSRLDNLLLRACPWLDRMCWNLVVCASHPTVADVASAGTPVSKPRWNIEIPKRDRAARQREPGLKT